MCKAGAEFLGLLTATTIRLIRFKKYMGIWFTGHGCSSCLLGR
jgi:hypothetical protein